MKDGDTCPICPYEQSGFVPSNPPRVMKTKNDEYLCNWCNRIFDAKGKVIRGLGDSAEQETEVPGELKDTE